MNKADTYFKQNLRDIRDFGTWDENPRPRYKDGEEANSIFITQVFEKYNIQEDEFPIPTIRNTAIKTGIKEMFWIYQKQSNKLSDAKELGINWWNEWDIGDGTIGQRYGATVKKYNLMNKLLKGLKENPFGRRHIMNLLQESDMEETKGLFPCAFETLWSVRKVNGDYFLDLTLNQRSNDYIMAGYINKIQYVALQMMVAGHLNYRVGNFSHIVQNLHIYDRHVDAMLELIDCPTLSERPMLIISGNKNFYDYTIDDFVVVNTSKIPKLNSKLEIAI